MRYAVVIPVYNEAETFPRLFDRLTSTAPVVHPETGEALEREVIIVDDGSTDGTRALAEGLIETPGVTVLLHDRNRGKGAAVRTGFARAVESGVDIALIQDADLEYDPAEHGALLAPILAGNADAVIGSRFIGQAHRVLYYWHSVANRVITTLSNMLTNLNLTDIECCFKAFDREVLERLTLTEDRFGIEPELIARVARLRLPKESAQDQPRNIATRPVRIFEIPVGYAGRTYEEGKKITWADGVAAVWCIVKYNVLR